MDTANRAFANNAKLMKLCAEFEASMTGLDESLRENHDLNALNRRTDEVLARSRHLEGFSRYCRQSSENSWFGSIVKKLAAPLRRRS